MNILPRNRKLAVSDYESLLSGAGIVRAKDGSLVFGQLKEDDRCD
jgi:hypothetical protein